MNVLRDGKSVELTEEVQASFQRIESQVAAHEAAQENKTLPRVEFLSRFTPEQRAAIYGARADDPIIDDLVMKLSTYEVLEKDDPLLTQGLDYLIQQGFITEADRTVLLG